MEPTIQFSNISISEANGVGATNSPTRESQAGRQAAQEFESLMLSQLTSALHPVNDDEEEEGGGGEKDFVRQMVTEQLAKNLAEQGGLGVGNLLAKYVDDGSGAAASGKSIERAIETARELRDGSAHPLGRREPPALVPSPKPDALTPNVITRPRRVTGLNPKPLESTLSQSASLSSSQGCGMSPLST
ncbi:MAG TPA: rod-binding protein, partial [Acidobacteriota bacterium]|nr:rod-binding protein [Acidobacteriota bacterium]